MKSRITIAKAYMSMLFFDVLSFPWNKWSDMRKQSKTILKLVKVMNKRK